jgi:hypothetical protein
MDKATRNVIAGATQRARRLLEQDISSQLEGTFDIFQSGAIGATGGRHLADREKILAAIDHKHAAGMAPPAAVSDYVRDAAFTTLNRFVALKMLEARELVQECISKGEQSSGYKEFCGMAPGLALLPDSAGYRTYIESLFDELSTEVKVLFDRLDLASIVWPRRGTFEKLLSVLNAPELAAIWAEDETLGWVYQYFNSRADIDRARYHERGRPKAPQNSRELAVRNQFFTPRYVVQFLTDNTLGRIWYEMRGGETRLAEHCEYLVRRPDETWEPRAKKDPRDLKVLDPACGSGHFLLYSFDLLLVIYEEGWGDPDAPPSALTGRSLLDDYPNLEALRSAVPELILRHNLNGIDIDPRCAQIGQLSLWMRAQRAFRDHGITRSDRPAIRRANIVIAEPMPGERDLLEEFLRGLKEDRLEGLLRRALDVPAGRTVRATKAMADSLAELVVAVWNSMRLAGEMGSLLKIDRALGTAIERGRAEWEGRLPLFRVSEYGLDHGRLSPLKESYVRLIPGEQEDFWANAEKLVFEALADYAATASGTGAARRRLFAEDALQGFALADLMTLNFDVALMNPPFSAVTEGTRAVVELSHPDSRYDIGAMFIEEFSGRLTHRGRLGAIFNRTNWFSGRLGRYRSHQLHHYWLACNADLGLGILDAFVETALTVVEASPPSSLSYWIRLVDTENKSKELRETITNIQNSAVNSRLFVIDQSIFAGIEENPYSYWVPTALLRARRQKSLADFGFEAKQGLATKDNFRFLRLQWEVTKYKGARWKLYSKGGAYAPLVGTYHLVIDWDRAAHVAYEKRDGQFCCLLTGRSHRYAYRPAVTYSQRTSKFSARIFPGGGLFDTKGSVVFAPNVQIPSAADDELIALCLVLNTALAQFFFDSSAGASDEGKARDYSQGMVGGLPAPPDIVAIMRPLIGDARAVYGQIVELQGLDPTSVYYHGVPPKCWWRIEAIDDLVKKAATLRERLVTLLGRATECYANSIGLGAIEKEFVNHTVQEMHRIANHESLELQRENVFAFLRQAILIEVFGGTLTQEHLENVAACTNSPLRELPWGALSNAGLINEILVDDPGQSKDLAAGLHSKLDTLGISEEQLPLFLDIDDLRTWSRSDAFSEHLRMFSRSQRAAPVVWQLGIPSCGYAIWLYVYGVNEDTLFRVQYDFVAPKLVYEQRQLEGMRADAGPNPRSTQRKIIEAQEKFVEELQDFLDQLKQVAPLWNPSLDDGVIINFAPLWRLVPQHKAWQREVKATWDALCAEEYDWAHLAMHFWPERVVPKCAADRSLAIAHGLEETFWEEDEDGKWQPRLLPLRPIEELVRERSSPAVKAALLSLLEAPVVGLGNGRGNRRSGRGSNR